ncbi:MAG: hypothetical protein KBS81_04795, partial [Spirochaetales bacterium]|nr:hypothetical protein [Candidatus Physcosoma equi]
PFGASLSVRANILDILIGVFLPLCIIEKERRVNKVYRLGRALFLFPVKTGVFPLGKTCFTKKQ